MVFVLAAYAQELKLCPLVGCPNLAHHMGILNGFQYGPRMRFKIFWFITFWRNEDLCHLISIWTSIILGYISYIFEKLMVIFIIAAVSLDTLLCISFMCYLTQCLILWYWKLGNFVLGLLCGKYMVFGIKVYEIWESTFNMENIIVSCTLSRLHFLCQDCPSMSTSQQHPSLHLSTGRNWTTEEHKNHNINFPKKHPTWQHL